MTVRETDLFKRLILYTIPYLVQKQCELDVLTAR